MPSGFRWPTLTGHAYWKAKSQFLLAVDTYQDWVMFVVEQGSFRYELGENGGIAERGDWILCAPNTPFRREALSPVDFHFITFALESDATKAAAESVPSPGTTLPPSGKYRPDAAMRIRDALDLLRDRVHAERPAFAAALRQHGMNELWLQLFASVHESSTGLPRQTTDPLMGRAAEIIREQVGSAFELRDLAAALSLTPVQFTRRFKAAYGRNPLQYATEIRMRIATKLLGETDMTLDAIAERCGYENGFYLSRVFKKQTGIAPSEFRKGLPKGRPIIV